MSLHSQLDMDIEARQALAYARTKWWGKRAYLSAELDEVQGIAESPSMSRWVSCSADMQGVETHNRKVGKKRA